MRWKSLKIRKWEDQFWKSSIYVINSLERKHFYSILSWGLLPKSIHKKKKLAVELEENKLSFCAENTMIYIQREIEKGRKKDRGGRNYWKLSIEFRFQYSCWKTRSKYKPKAFSFTYSKELEKEEKNIHINHLPLPVKKPL